MISYIYRKYYCNFFSGQVIDKSQDTFTIKCMEAAGSGDSGAFIWPKKEDIIAVGQEKLIKAIPDPIPVLQRHIGWSRALLEEID